MNCGLSINNYHNTGGRSRQNKIGTGRNELGEVAYFCAMNIENITV